MHRTNKKFLLLDIIRMQDLFEEGLGLASLTACLREENYTVEIQKYRENAINFDAIYAFAPDIIGITCGSYNLKLAISVCEKIRAEHPEIILCAGGYSPTFYYKEILEETNAIDCLMRGEGEKTIVELSNVLLKKGDLSEVKGIVYRDENGEIVVTAPRPQIEDLDSLPLPARDILKQYKLNIAPLESSRGCLGRCSFCSFKQFWVDTSTERAVCFREKSPERVIEEIKQVVKETGVNRVTFVDGSYELSPKYKREKLRKIAQGILDNNLNISYYFSARISFIDTIGDEVLDLMIKSGFCGVFLGVESFYQADLDLFRKGTTVQENIRVLEECQKYPFNVDIGLINFQPFSTFESLRQNAYYVHKYKYAARFFLIEPLILFRGTQIYDECKRMGLILEEDMIQVKKYIFKDSRIGVLYEYISKYFSECINKERVYTAEISDYFNDHLDVMCGIKHYFETRHKSMEAEIVSDYVEKLCKNQCKLNDINQKWFLDLVNLAEEGCTDEKAYFSILEKQLPLSFVQSFAKELSAQKFRVFLQLQRIDRKYKDLF